MRNTILVLSVLAALTVFQESFSNEKDKLQYPLVVKRGEVVYPNNRRRDASGGIVEILTMVDKQGKPFSPMILRSTNKYFDKAALNAIEGYVFEPATYGASPVESFYELRLRFVISKEKGAVTEDFSRYYRRALDVLNSDDVDLKQVDANMRRMRSSKGLSTYALAYYYLIAARRAAAARDDIGTIEASKMLLLFEDYLEDASKILDQKTKASIRQSFIVSLAKTQRYSEALEVYADLKSDGAMIPEPIEQLIANIRSHLEADAASVIDVVISESHPAIEEIFEKSFTILDVTGELTAFNLRCNKKFHSMTYQPDAEYQIPSAWGRCRIEFLGEEGTSLKLAQY